MAVTYFDINDQYSKANIEAAEKEAKLWDCCGNHFPNPWKAMDSLPEKDEEAFEIKR